MIAYKNILIKVFSHKHLVSTTEMNIYKYNISALSCVFIRDMFWLWLDSHSIGSNSFFKYLPLEYLIGWKISRNISDIITQTKLCSVYGLWLSSMCAVPTPQVFERIIRSTRSTQSVDFFHILQIVVPGTFSSFQSGSPVRICPVWKLFDFWHRYSMSSSCLEQKKQLKWKILTLDKSNSSSIHLSFLSKHLFFCTR